MLKLQWYWKNRANGRQRNAQKKSELLWPWPWKEQKEFFIYVVLRAGKFFKVFFCRKKIVVLRDYPYHVIKLLLRFSICPGKIIFLVEFCISFVTCNDVMLKHDPLIRNKRFMLDEMTQWNAWKFALFYFVLLYFFL